ncbi:hypothetical protein Tco_1031820 [Tanacetum coccineum]|uniref:Uncharacterized protein n=1 Tax=Tanacetum coccineum TaxID=301880 RepID=A0ABQ5GAA1_9ASTR
MDDQYRSGDKLSTGKNTLYHVRITVIGLALAGPTNHIHHFIVISARAFLEGTPNVGNLFAVIMPGVLGGNTHDGNIFLYYCPGVLGGNTHDGNIFLYYCPGVLGGNTYDGDATIVYPIPTIMHHPPPAKELTFRDTRVQDTERRTMASVEVVNLRVGYQADVRRRDTCFTRREQRDLRQAWLVAEAYSRALKAWIRVLETQVYHHDWKRQDADDRAIKHIIRTQALEAGARVDTLEDTGSSA